MSEKEREEKFLRSIHSVNGLKKRVGSKYEDGMKITVTISENAIKKTFGKRVCKPLDFDSN